MFDILPINGGICAIEGIYCDGVSANLKANNALDIAFIYSEKLLQIEALFTQNRFKAAPLRHYERESSKILHEGSNFILINTKNANAMTGERGMHDIDEILGALCAQFPQIKNPIMSSTGVIGQYLPKEKIIDSFAKFNLSAKNPTNAANAIRTTDRFTKEIALQVDLVGESNANLGESNADSRESKGDFSADSNKCKSFKIAGFAKGAGMIEPNMATMLCYIITDAQIPQGDMRELLQICTKTTFNAISVDGDTSTNDSVFLMTTNATNAYDKDAFKVALEMIMKKLALDIVKDGEGSTKVVAFEVVGAVDLREAEICAKALANSLLVKTALFGCDPNWGRIASTIGSCGVSAESSKLTIKIGEVAIFEREKIYFENEAKCAEIMKNDSFKISCDLGLGDGRFTAYGCDLGNEYVRINSDYRS